MTGFTLLGWNCWEIRLLVVGATKVFFMGAIVVGIVLGVIVVGLRRSPIMAMKVIPDRRRRSKER